MRSIVRSLIVILSLYSFSNSQDRDILLDTAFVHLSGRLPEKLTNDGKHYLVVGDISVPAGVTVSIDPGVVFLFRDFTGLQVNGTLLANGTKDEPIIFTSDNDRRFVSSSQIEAAPYDWNGLTIYENAFGSTFKWCSINYSLFGVNSLTPMVTLKNCLFNQNGKSDLVIQGDRKTIDKQPFSYISTELSVPGFNSNQPIRSTAAGTVMRISGLTLFVAGTAVGAYRTMKFRESDARLDDLGDTKKQENNPFRLVQWENARVERNNDLAWAIAGFGTALVGVLGFSISFNW